MAERKNRTYKKGMMLFHKQTKQKIMFGNWTADKKAVCLTNDKNLLTLSREQLDNDYTSYAELDRLAREKRRGQGW
jgi:hypothetical protein